KECIELCEACAEECGGHEHDHCKACAKACAECAEACRANL
ncbi:MAG: four-helix bundle copper-binding protein, partial [Ferruginibacter sp.]